MHAFREHGRARPRILYWSRGPVAPKVGRPPIDEEAIRLIEEHHRGLSFDWPKILASRAVTEAERVLASERQAPIESRGRSRDQDRGPAPPVPDNLSGGAAGSAVRGDRPNRRRSRHRRRGREAADIEGVSDARTPAARAAEAAEPARATAAEEFFSPEDLTRLRGRHAALLARIDREVGEAASAGQLREAAEALNPDTWVTRTDMDQALEHYEERYRRLLEALGPRQRPRAVKPDGEQGETVTTGGRGSPDIDAG